MKRHKPIKISMVHLPQ